MAENTGRGGNSRQGRPPAKRSSGTISGGRSTGRGAGTGGSTRGGSSGSGGTKRAGSGGTKRAGSGGTKRAGSGGTKRAGSGGTKRAGSGSPGRSGGAGQAGAGAGGRGAPRKGSPSGRTGGRSPGSQSSGGRSAAPRRDREEAPKRGGGFGPYAVDQRDEETREKRGTRSGDGRSGARSTARSAGGAASQERPALRTVGKRTVKDTKARTSRRAQQESPSRRRRKRGPADVQQELGKLAGRNASRALGTLMAAADAFANDREREALRILRPLREQLPDSPSVRELAGLCQYRIGNYAAAAKELEAYADLSDSVEQHPVLMDCYRAQRRWRKVEQLWLELAAVSPSSELVTEGRIVYAGALADQDRLPEALSLLRKRAERIKKPAEHQLRLIYALGDLEERAGNLARARELFHEVRRADASFSDVAERLAALG
jgi:hypothetical protein